MKTDFEFIKDKFDESEVKAPESLNEEFVLDKIKDTKPVKNRKPLIASLSAAAAVAVVTAVAVAVTSIIGSTPQPVKVAGTKARLENFKSADDVKEAIRKINKESEKYYIGKGDYAVAEDAAGGAADGGNNLNYKSTAIAGSAKTADAGHNATYTQYTNVDEADVVKTDGKYIYYLDLNTINVFSTEGKKSKKVAEITPDKAKKATDFDYYSNYCTIDYSDFYLNDNRLIAIGDIYGQAHKTSVDVFDISNIKNIKTLDRYYQSGSYCSSRMIGDMLYVVSNHYADEKNLPCAGKSNPKTSTDDEATPNEIPCTDIYTVEKPSTPNFLVVSGIDTSNGAQVTKTKAILGSADTVYCNTDHLFVTAAEYIYGNRYGDLYWFGSAVTNTQIVKVDLNNNLDFTATTKVRGYVDNQYALDEKDGNLRVAVTYNADKNKANQEINRLFILDKNLKQIGKTEEFAKGESIKAVRYIGDTAYVITYEQTDPLFVIDTSNASNPKILGEVKISGFSTMLVPVDDNTLLGIGYYTQDEDYTDMEVQEGVKLALFDVSDKANPKVLDEKVFKGYESEVQYNPKALLVNFERKDYTIPYSHYDEPYIHYDENDGDEYYCTYGVINFKVKDGKIKIVDEYKSDKFYETEDVENTLDRCAYVGDYIYMVGNHYDHNGYDEEDSYDVIIDAVKYK